MAVAFRSSQSVTNGTAGTSVTVSKPAVIVDAGANRDHLIAVIAAVGVPTITPPAGWTLITTAASGSALTVWCYRKLAASEGASWTWTLGSAQRNWGYVGAYSGVDPDDPLYVTSVGLDTTLTGSTVLSTSAQLPSAGMVIPLAAATRTASGVATTWTVVDLSAVAMTERLDTSTNAGAGTDISGVVAENQWLGDPFDQAWDLTASQAQTDGLAMKVSLRPYFVPYDGSITGVGLVLEAAFGADPDSASSTWTWTDLSKFVHQLGPPTLRHGRANRTSIADPSEMTFTLLNLNGEFTSPSGIYGTRMTRNLPFRIRLTGFGVGSTLGYQRGTAFLSSLRPRWDPSGNVSFVDIVASGRLRRLQQRTEPIRSAAYTAIQRMPSTGGYTTPVAHWPFEDEAGAGTPASAVSGVPPASQTGLTFGADSTCIGSAPLATQTATSVWNAVVPTYVSTGTWTGMCVTTVPAEPGVETGLLTLRTTGTAAVWQITIAPGAPSLLHVRAYTAALVSILDDSTSVIEAEFYGVAQFLTLEVTQNGGNIDYTVFFYNEHGNGGKTGTLVANTCGNVTSFYNIAQAGLAGASIGHVALHVQPGADGGQSYTAVTLANAGEWPWDRFARICNEQDIPYTLDVSDNFELKMGPQSVSTVMSLLREAETVEGCVLNDSGPAGVLWFPARDDRQNNDASMTLDVDRGEVAPPFSPTLDDQDIVNDVEVSRDGGSSARVEDTSSINTEGRYREQVIVNTEDDRFLADLAGWRRNLGTVAGMRFPSVSWNLRGSPQLAEQWVNMRLFDRIDILHPLSHYPGQPITALLEGYTETISGDTWTITANLSPEEPWEVFTIGTGTDNRSRIPAGITTLNIGYGATDTSLAVTSGGTPWIDSATYAAQFPISIVIAREVMSLTAVTGTGLAQTFTVVRGTYGQSRSLPSGSAVQIYRPTVVPL